MIPAYNVGIFLHISGFLYLITACNIPVLNDHFLVSNSCI